MNSTVEGLAKDKRLEKIVRKEVPEMRPEHSDLCQDLYLDLLQKPEKRLKFLEKTGLLEPYLVRMVRNNLHSSTSRFYYTYRKFGLLNAGEEATRYRECPSED